MTTVESYVGEVRGVRMYQTGPVARHPAHRLRSLSWETGWDPGEPFGDARCLNFPRSLGFVSAGPDHGAAPSRDCPCGFYACWDIPQLLARLDTETNPHYVMVRVAASGRMQLADYGWRAQKIRIDAFVTWGDVDLAPFAAAWGVPIITPEEVEPESPEAYGVEPADPMDSTLGCPCSQCVATRRVLSGGPASATTWASSAGSVIRWATTGTSTGPRITTYYPPSVGGYTTGGADLT